MSSGGVLTEYSHAVAQFGMTSSDRITALSDHIVDIQKIKCEYQHDPWNTNSRQGRCSRTCVSIKEVQHDAPSQDSPEPVVSELEEGKGVCSWFNKASPLQPKAFDHMVIKGV